jgi:predicted nucleic acid-binding protein
VPENKVVITDSSCFILLYKIDAISILHDLFELVLTTHEVAIEFGFPLPEWVIIQPVNNKSLKEELNEHVDLGEASAIALAYEVKSDYLILDDLEARKFARKLGFNIKGTLGILLDAKSKGVIQQLKPYLDLVQQTDFRFTEQLIKFFLKEANEE